MEETLWVTGSCSCPSSPTHKFTSRFFFQPLLHPVEERVEKGISFHLHLAVNRSRLPLNAKNFAFNVRNATLFLQELAMCPGGWVVNTSARAWVSHRLLPLCWPDGEGFLQIRLGAGQAEGRA